MTDTVPEAELAEMAELAAEVAAQDAAEAPQDDAPADEPQAEAPADEPQAKPEPEKVEPPKLTDEQKTEAKRLRVEEGLLLAEIAERLGVPMKLVSSLLLGVVAGKKKDAAPKNPNRTGAAKHRGIATADWPTFIKGLPHVADGVVPWPRAAYCLVRADNTKTGVQKGKVFSAEFPFPWATVCGHGTIKGAMKGAVAETQGKDRDTWCTQCAEGAPMDGLQPLPKPDGETVVETEGVVGTVDLRPVVQAEGPATSVKVVPVEGFIGPMPEPAETRELDVAAAHDQALEVEAARARDAKQEAGEQATEEAKTQARPKSRAARNAARRK